MMEKLDSYLQFIQFCLDEGMPMPQVAIEQMDWGGLLEFARQQAIVGICFEGMKRLGDSVKNKPSHENLMQWMSMAVQIERRNKRLNELVVKVSDVFDKEGFASLVLKGQGNALMYPQPLSRTSGDIDIWVVPKEKMVHPELFSVHDNRETVIRYIRQFSPNSYLNFQHIGLDVYEDCEVEVHFLPTVFNNRIVHRRFMLWLKSEMGKLFINKPHGFPMPTDHFNRIYQLCHIQHHYFDEGIGLRQMMDYYYLLKRGFTEKERLQEIAVLKRLNMLSMAGAVMFVLQHMLGLKSQYLLVKPDERRGKVLEREILSGGNFGKDFKFNDRNKASKYWAKTLRNLKVIRFYPSETLWEPPFRLWHFLWRMQRRFFIR